MNTKIRQNGTVLNRCVQKNQVAQNLKSEQETGNKNSEQEKRISEIRHTRHANGKISARCYPGGGPVRLKTN
jgi:ribosomal protein L25 (general stress protein Ctc)